VLERKCERVGDTERGSVGEPRALGKHRRSFDERRTDIDPGYVRAVHSGEKPAGTAESASDVEYPCSRCNLQLRRELFGRGKTTDMELIQRGEILPVYQVVVIVELGPFESIAYLCPERCCGVMAYDGGGIARVGVAHRSIQVAEIEVKLSRFANP